MQRTDNDILCDALDVETAYSARLLEIKLADINAAPALEVNRAILTAFLTEIHARIITIQHDLELRSSKITVKVMRNEIENLKRFERDIYDMYPEYFL